MNLALTLCLTAALSVAAARGSHAQDAAADEAAIRDLIGQWYLAQRAGPDGQPHILLAPGAINASPGYAHRDTGSTAAGPRIYTSLAFRALTFSHEITQLVIDPRFARAHVRERGYFYAWRAQRTYESMGSATFVLEKRDGGRWLILAHRTNTIGIPPNLKTEPMPDLRDLFYATRGKDRDPEADARAARGSP